MPQGPGTYDKPGRPSKRAFKLRSGNSPAFKQMGSMPMSPPPPPQPMQPMQPPPIVQKKKYAKEEKEGSKTAEEFFNEQAKKLGLSELLKKEKANLGTKPKGSYSDKEQKAIDELNKRITAYENRPK